MSVKANLSKIKGKLSQAFNSNAAARVGFAGWLAAIAVSYTVAGTAAITLPVGLLGIGTVIFSKGRVLKKDSKLSKAFNSTAGRITIGSLATAAFVTTGVLGAVAGAPLAIVAGALGTVAFGGLLTDQVLLAKTGRPLFDRYEGDNSYQWSDIKNTLKNLPRKTKNKASAAAKKLRV